MTKREFYTAVITMSGEGSELATMALAELALLDKKNEKAKATRLAKSGENAPLVKAICDYLANHKVALASELAQACDVSTPKVVAIAKKMSDEGIISTKKVKVAKVGERNAYSLIKSE